MSGGTIGRGTIWLIVGRLAGMAGGFLLFILLSWRSTETVGIFRTAFTFLLVLDYLPLLGMHRWLASEIASDASGSRAVFALSCRLAIIVALACSAILALVAVSGIYGFIGSQCIGIVALTTIPSAINLCVMSALIGLGHSQQSAIISLLETIVRTSLAIVLVAFGASLLWIFILWSVVRWAFAAKGFQITRSHVAGLPSFVSAELRASFRAQLPNLAMAMSGFLVMRMSAMLILPLVSSAAEAGLYAASFQLFDLVLLVPTILTISTNYAFVQSAARSASALLRATNQLICLTALFVLPVVAIGFVLARLGIEGLFGPAFAGSVTTFRLLLAALVVMALDQILSLVMAVSHAYRADRICITTGATVVIIGTSVLGHRWGAEAAALSLLLGSGTTLALRISMMPQLLQRRLFTDAIRREALAAALAAAAMSALVPIIVRSGRFLLPVTMLAAVAGSALYLGLVYAAGGLRGRRLQRTRHFMIQRG